MKVEVYGGYIDDVPAIYEMIYDKKYIMFW